MLLRCYLNHVSLVTHVCQWPKVLMSCILLLALNPEVTVFSEASWFSILRLTGFHKLEHIF